MINKDSYAFWVLQCLGVTDGGEYLDKMENDFGVEVCPTDTGTLDDIRIQVTSPYRCPKLGDVLAERIFDEVIEKAVDELNAKEDDFEYSANGLYDTYLTYKGKTVETWDEIVNIYNKKNRRKQK